jgi:PmbA protein
MIDKIKKALIQNQNITGYKIIENKIESKELFFIKKNIDMDRAKSVHHYDLTVYKDFEENGERYKGASTTSIYPTMDEEELQKSINDAAFVAQFVKNLYYPLVKAGSDYEALVTSNFSREDLSYWINEITRAVYKYDNCEKGGINSCEIFLNKRYTHIINSEGIDVEEIRYEGMVEFITTWKEEGEEVELYQCINLSDLNSEALSQEIEKTIALCKDRAIAKSTPVLNKTALLLTREAVKSFCSFYCAKSSAEEIYEGSSTWKVGDKVQGEEVMGDLVTIRLDPFMINSTDSSSFDSDGFPLKPVTVLEKGVLKSYAADTRHAFYLGVQPTGNINNIVVGCGTKTLEELRKEPYLETAAFSDFTVDTLTGDFFGEIRLAWFFDGEKITPVTGGSISGNINELQKEMYFSKELKKDNNFEGPEAVKVLNVNVAGVQ